MALMKLILLATLLVGIEGKCPQPELLYPCKCQYPDIACTDREKHYDIEFIFKTLSKNIKSEEDLHFDTFSLTNPYIEELEDNVFGSITFKKIQVSFSDNLRRISANAFNSSVDTIEEISLRFLYKLGENSNGYELYNLLSSLNNLKSVNLIAPKITEIPPNAFSNPKQTKLESIDYQNGSLVTIGNYAFSALTNLKYLNLRGVGINYIPKHAFDFNVPSNQTLNIDIAGNPMNQGFEIGTFLNAKRPLSLTYYSKPLEMSLDEKIFSPFLRLDKRNSLSCYSARSALYFKCDCQDYWLVRDKSIFKNQLNVSGTCLDGIRFEHKSLNELDESYFTQCK